MPLLPRDPSAGSPGDPSTTAQAAQQAAPASSTTLAQRLDRLWRLKEQEEGRDISYRVAIDEMVERFGLPDAPMSPTHLNNIHRGVTLNPTVEIIETVAHYFEVDPAYFITSDELLAEALLDRRNRFVSSERTTFVNRLAEDPQYAATVRSLSTLTPNSLVLVMNMAQFLADHERVPPPFPLSKEPPDDH